MRWIDQGFVWLATIGLCVHAMALYATLSRLVYGHWPACGW